MVEVQLETSNKPSEILMAFPHYRRSHLRSGTYHTLVRILSHCSNERSLPGSNENHSASQVLKNHDNGMDRMQQESQEKEPKDLQFSGTDLMNLNHPVSHKEKQFHESSDGREFMKRVEEDVGSTGRQDMVICERESVEALSMGTNDLNKEQEKMEELNQRVKENENLIGNGSIPLNLGLGENQNRSSEVDLMDYQVDYVEFRGSNVNTSGTESKSYIEEFNQKISEGFDASLIANISTSEKKETSIPEVSTSSITHERQLKEMELVTPPCAAMVSLPLIEEGEFEKEEHGEKVHLATNLSQENVIKYSESFNWSIELERLQKEMELELVESVSAAVVSLPSTEKGKFEKEEWHGQKVFKAMQLSVDQSMNNEESNSSVEHDNQKREMDSVKSVGAAMVSLPSTKESEFEKEEQHGPKASEAMRVSVGQSMNGEALISSIKLNEQDKEMELVKPVFAAITTTEEGESKKEDQQGKRVSEAMQFSTDQDMNNEASSSHIRHEKQEKEMDSSKSVCTAFVSLPTTKEGEFDKEERHGQKVHEVMCISGDQGMDSEALILKTKPETQKSEMELAKLACPAIVSLPEIEEEEQKEEDNGSDGYKPTKTYVRKSKKRDLGHLDLSGRRVAEAVHLSVNQGINGETSNVSEHSEEVSFMDIDIIDAKEVIQHEEELPEKTTRANDATFSNHLDKEGDIEEGELSDDLRMDESSIDVSSSGSLMIAQRGHVVQKPQCVIENIVFPSNKQKEEKEFKSTQDACNSALMEPRKIDKNGFTNGVDFRSSREIIDYGDIMEHDSVSVTGKSEDRNIKGVVGLPTTLAKKKALAKVVLEEEGTEDNHNTSAVKKAAISRKKKRGPVTEERKAKKKEKKRKQRAEKNRELGVKRLKLQPVQKPKTITHCRHYLMGRCHEADKCKFSHDVVPLTKSKPCCHFARHSCMKGDDCPFDHQLSKYPCSNFATKGSCSRGNACMFSHQMPTKQDVVATSSNDSKAELKPKLLGNTTLSKRPNISSSSASQQKQISDSKGVQSHFNSEKGVVDSVKKPPTIVPKGINFINVSKSSSPRQGMVTPNKENFVQIGTPAGPSASSATTSNSTNPEKRPVVAPKGINFLSFGKCRVSSFKSPVCSFLNKENGVKLPHKESLDTPEQASLEKDDLGRVGSGTKQSVLQSAGCSNEISKQNQSIAQKMELGFQGTASMNHYSNDVHSSSTSHQDSTLSRSAQERVNPYTPQTSTLTSSLLPTSPFVSSQSSERLTSGHHKHVFNSTQRALLSTLSFAAEQESNIKLKFPVSASAFKLEANKDV